MKKTSYFFLILSFVISIQNSFSQNIYDLNFYKYLIVKSETTNSDCSNKVKTYLEQYFTKIGMPVSSSKRNLLLSNINDCDILTCSFELKTLTEGYAYYNFINLAIFDCFNENILSFSAKRQVAPFNKDKCENFIEPISIQLNNKLNFYKYCYNDSLFKIRSKLNNSDTITQIIYVNQNNNDLNKYKYSPNADIDSNIPISGLKNELYFALIVGNEDYNSFQNGMNSEINVDFARNDASTFKEYAIKTLGIPEKNITFIMDGTSAQIHEGLQKLNLLIKNTQGKAKVLFYYAGHGLPDEITKEPYLIPVDVSGTNLISAIKLNYIYNKLTEYPSSQITVVLDACFSGGARNQGLVAARAIKIKPKDEILKGNIIVFSSSSGSQSSLPYKEKQHGLFTYYFLKKIQETQGNINYKVLSDYLLEKIVLESILINNKEQTPQVLYSPNLNNVWNNWQLK